METYQVFSSTVAVAFFLAVFWLIRRDSILVGAAFRWFIIAILALVLGIYPKISDFLAGLLGIAYPPILPIIIACLLLLLKALFVDIQLSKLKLKQDRATQKMAILEHELEEIKLQLKKLPK